MSAVLTGTAREPSHRVSEFVAEVAGRRDAVLRDAAGSLKGLVVGVVEQLRRAGAPLDDLEFGTVTWTNDGRLTVEVVPRKPGPDQYAESPGDATTKFVEAVLGQRLSGQDEAIGGPLTNVLVGLVDQLWARCLSERVDFSLLRFSPVSWSESARATLVTRVTLGGRPWAPRTVRLW